MSPTRTNKQIRPLPQVVDNATFQHNTDPVFVAAVNRAADLKCLMAIQSGRLRVVSPYKFPEPLRYIPRMDLIDDPSSSKFSAVFEIPGIKTNDVTLGIRGGKLIILGQRKPPHPNAAKPEASSQSAASPAVASGSVESNIVHTAVRMPIHELRYGTFERAIPIPAGVKESDIQATLADGMLMVTWPKSSATAAAAGTVTPPRSTLTSSPPATLVTAGTASQ